MKKLFYIFIVLCFTVTVQATNYYVDDDAADDTGTGLTGDPWKTIGKVNTVNFADGDIIYFDKGDTFDDTPLTFGAVTNPSTKTITVDAYGTGALPWLGGTANNAIYVNNNNQDLLSLVINNIKIDSQEPAGYPKIYLRDVQNVTISI